MSSKDHRKKFLFVLLENFSLAAFSNAIEPLRLANRIAKTKFYNWQLASVSGNSVECSNGISFQVSSNIQSVDAYDCLVLCSGENVKEYCTRNLINWLRKEARGKALIGALCTAPYILAKSGLLENKNCTIHWENYESMKEEFGNLINQKLD